MSADALEPLRLRFRQRAGEESRHLADALARGDISEIERLAHGLAGVAGLFGFADVGAQALEIDGEFARGEALSLDKVRALIIALERLSPYS